MRMRITGKEMGMQAIAALSDCAYDPPYGFRDSVMANPGAPDYGQCSDRYSALAQAWIFLAIVNYENDFIGRTFYRDPGVLRAHVEMYGGTVYLPLMHKAMGLCDIDAKGGMER